jgi:Ca2+/H+ antiporter, TMEM165/GDT1 family
MDWKLLVSTFGAVFIAELGDKTQLATFALAAGGSSRWVVFVGAAAALIASTAVAVLLGGALGRVVSPALLRRAAGVVFIALGLVFLLGRGESQNDRSDGGTGPSQTPTDDAQPASPRQ